MNSDAAFEPVDDYKAPRTVINNRTAGWIPVALAAGLVAVAGFSFYQYSQMNSLRQQMAESQDKQTADVQSQLAAQNASLKGTVSDLQSRLAEQQQATTQSIASVRDSARRQADIAAGRVQKTLEQKNAEQQEAFNTEIAGVKTAASDAATKLDGVGQSVETVKTDLASTKADLQRANGDMGVMSGLIATNGKEIQELRAMGDRNIYEFTIAKKNGMQKIGDVQIKLTKADQKHNRYTMVVMADDKFVEKRDKTTNEPVQFYAIRGSRTPYEVVVNEVGKDTIKGYLATPKISTARN